jgi:subtilase family serine protease
MSFRNLTAKAAVAALALFALSPFTAFALPAHNVPEGLALAADQGRVDPGQEVNLTLVLALHDRAGFDRAVEALYDPASPTFHEWFTGAEFDKFVPSVEEYETVKNELTKQGFSIISTDPLRITIRVHGTVETVEKAFQTELHTFIYQGRTFQAHIRDAQLAGAAGDLVDAVCGIERHPSQPQLSQVKNPKTGQPAFKKLLKTKADLTAFTGSLTDTPLSVSTNIFWVGDFDNYAYYTGLEYGANGMTAAFTPAQLQAHYGVPFTQSETKFDGTGQTIALVEAYGYPTAEADANEAATLFGLPALTSTNFSVVYPNGKPLNANAGVLSGWDTEIALDIQSSHSIAPGAKIVVVASPGQDNEDQIASLSYIINPTNAATPVPLAHTVSSSWENDDEILSGSLEENAFNTVLETGAAAGISFQFSSGDGGDLGLGTPVGAVMVPANSPYVTAVGGTSILNNPYGTGQVVTGWGNDVVYLNYQFDGYNDLDDPREGLFFFGAGGGQSQFYSKPTWQKALSGSWRQVPDVSALADPYTGFPIVITLGTGTSAAQYGEVFGGTSLASPIFTAVWAVADQFNGTALGQAAPAIAGLSAADITDVIVPPYSLYQYDVTGFIDDSNGLTTANWLQIFTQAIDEDDYPNDMSLYSQKVFVSAIYPNAWGENGEYVVVGFGTDSSLTVGTGWDNVTGWGEPSGLTFIQGVTGKTTGEARKK